MLGQVPARRIHLLDPPFHSPQPTDTEPLVCELLPSSGPAGSLGSKTEKSPALPTPKPFNFYILFQ